MHDIHILVVDDNPSIHIDFQKILVSDENQNQALMDAEAAITGKLQSKNEFKFLIDSAYQAEDALELIRKGLNENQHYSLVFVDIRMPPGMDGVEAIGHIWKLDPDIQIVICTAYSDYSWDDLNERFPQTDRLLILKKPFENIEVLQITNTLAKKWQISKSLQEQMNHLEELVSERTAKLEHSLSLTQATLEATSDGILVVDLDQKTQGFNQNLINLLNIPQSVLAEKNNQKTLDYVVSQFVNAEDFYNKIRQADEHPEIELSDTLHLKDKKIIAYYSRPHWLDNKITGRVFSFRDITEYKRMEKQLIHQATHDTVTNLPNRLVLQDRIDREIIAAKTNKTIVAFLFIDLDNFKLINETLGHDYGDEVLKIMATRLQEEMPETNTLARISGDEFVIVIPLKTKIDTLIFICQVLLAKIAVPFEIKSQMLALTASIGISLYPKDGEEASILLKNADMANHFAKESGRNTFNFFTMELNISATKRLKLESNLHLALEKHEFHLNYQPIIDTVSKKVLCFEALLHWQHPTLGLIPPDQFIPVADDIGLMLSIGDWILETVCAQNKAWRDQGITIVPIAINLTAKQIAQPGIAERISEVLQQNQLDPTILTLEITESTIVELSDKVIRIMEELKNVGLKLAIDDFGTGYSSLNYLNRLPIDKIKIDRSFITHINENANNVTVVQTIIAMTKSLKIRSLAEGVETKEQFETLANFQCDEIQGFYFYRPQSAKNAEKILRQQSIIDVD